MAIYCVGDVHGCYNELKKLIKIIDFDKNHDELLLTGDIIGRGPNPLEVVNLIMDLGDRAQFVLGNHDLNFLSIALGLKKAKKKDNLDKLLNSKNLDNIIDFFLSKPLMYIHPSSPIFLAHAGINPKWDLDKAYTLAKEVEEVLKNRTTAISFLSEMFGDLPNEWNDNLTGNDRYRFITNSFTRMRFCYPDGKLELNHKSTPENGIADGLVPWYELHTEPFDKNNQYTLIFGHWAALGGRYCHPKAKNLDTGCVWGNKLTMWCYDTDTIYSVQSTSKIKD